MQVLLAPNMCSFYILGPRVGGLEAARPLGGPGDGTQGAKTARLRPKTQVHKAGQRRAARAQTGAEYRWKRLELSCKGAGYVRGVRNGGANGPRNRQVGGGQDRGRKRGYKKRAKAGQPGHRLAQKIDDNDLNCSVRVRLRRGEWETAEQTGRVTGKGLDDKIADGNAGT